MIAPQILFISTFLSVFWGIYLVYTVTDYQRVRNIAPYDRRGRDMIAAFRRMLVALCLWSICFAYVFRTICILTGIGDAFAAQVTFFAILGLNVPSSIYAVVSLAFD